MTPGTAAGLPPTSLDLLTESARPYFVWWAEITVGGLKEKLASSDIEERAYWLGALLREANTRDVWLFTTPGEIRTSWVHVVRYLGSARQRWAWLLDIPDPGWPPPEARRLHFGSDSLELDLVHEAMMDLAEPTQVESILVESAVDLRASKLTCILSRSEPRDLVDLLHLERDGHPPEADLESALRKDGGIDLGVLAWLLRQFPVEPLPTMLTSLTVDELRRYRDDLADRFKRLSQPAS